MTPVARSARRAGDLGLTLLVVKGSAWLAIAAGSAMCAWSI